MVGPAAFAPSAAGSLNDFDRTGGWPGGTLGPPPRDLSGFQLELVAVSGVDGVGHPDRVALLVESGPPYVEHGHLHPVGQIEEGALVRVRWPQDEVVAPSDLIDAEATEIVDHSASMSRASSSRVAS